MSIRVCKAAPPMQWVVLPKGVKVLISDVHRFFISQKSACKKKAVARWTKTWEILQNCNLSVCFATFHLLIELLQLLFCLFKRRCQQRWVWNFCLLAASAFLSEMPRVKKGNGCCSTEVCNQGMNWQYPLWTIFWSKFNTNQLAIPNGKIVPAQSSPQSLQLWVPLARVHWDRWLSSLCRNRLMTGIRKIQRRLRERKWARENSIQYLLWKAHLRSFCFGRPWHSTTCAIDKNFRSTSHLGCHTSSEQKLRSCTWGIMAFFSTKTVSNTSQTRLVDIVSQSLSMFGSFISSHMETTPKIAAKGIEVAPQLCMRFLQNIGV